MISKQRYDEITKRVDECLVASPKRLWQKIVQHAEENQTYKTTLKTCIEKGSMGIFNGEITSIFAGVYDTEISYENDCFFVFSAITQAKMRKKRY